MAVDVDFLSASSTSNIDSNFQRVKEALEDTVGRSGDLPNQMNSDLDMNSNDLLNVKNIEADSLIVDGQIITIDIEGFIPADDSISTIKLQDGSVTYDKLADEVIEDIDNSMKKEGGVWLGQGLRITNIDEGTNPTDAVNKSQLDEIFDTVTDTTRNIPHPNFNFINDYGTIFDCSGPGRARHNIDIAIAWQHKNKLLTGSSGLNFQQPSPNLVGDKFVDWVNGNDANAGSISSPYKTVKKAYQNSLHTVWLLPQVSKEILSLTVADRTLGSGAPRATRIKALVPNTVTFVGANQTAADMTWTLAGTAYTATPSPVANVASITWNPSPGVYVPVPYTPAMNTGFYWNQDSGTKLITIRLFGMDMTVAATKAQIIIQYIPASNSVLTGIKTLFEDVNFVAHPQIDILHDTTYRPEVFFKNCKFVLAPQNAISTAGGLIVSQNCFIYGSASDGFNYYGDVPTNTAVTFLEIDNVAKFAGWMHSTAGTPVNRNHQSSTGHDNSYGIRINCDYGEGNYGQSIADTGSAAYYWMIGTICRNPYFNQYASTNDNYISLHVEGFTWLDNVQAGGLGSSVGLEAVNSTAFEFSSDFSGLDNDVTLTNSTLSEYIPFG